MRRTWRRRSIEVAACIIAGAALTVVAAWACALWTPAPDMTAFQVMGIIESDGNPRPMPQTTAGAAFGLHIERDGHIAWEGTSSGRGLGIEMDADRLASGWPFYALECSVVYHTQQPPTAHVRAAERIGSNADGGPWLVDGAPAPTWKRFRAQPWRFVPLRPRLVGFAADVLIIGAVLWFAGFGWRDVRVIVRNRSGRCLACGYPVTGLGRCPECGESVWSAWVQRLRSRALVTLDGIGVAIRRRGTR